MIAARAPSTSTALRPYQVAAIESLRRHVAAGSKRLLLTVPTGGGKTLTAAELMRSALSYGKRVLFVVHLRELVDQTVRALESCGIDHVGVMRGDDDRIDEHAPIQVASIQTLARRVRPHADIVILDECFVAGTRVGLTTIDKIRVGDVVPSFCTKTGDRSSRRVVRVIQRRAKALCTVRTSSGDEVVCTPNHKIWSRSGWVHASESAGLDVMLEVPDGKSADNVRSVRRRNRQTSQEPSAAAFLRPVQSVTEVGETGENEAVCRMPSTVAAEAVRQGVAPNVLGGVQAETHSERAIRVRHMAFEIQHRACFRSHEAQQSDAYCRDARARKHDATSNGAPAEGARRERSAAPYGSTGAGWCTGLVYGGRRVHWPSTEVAERGQDRHCESRRDDRGGGRRLQPRCHVEERTGREEGVVLAWTRVEGVQVHEPTGDGQFGGMCPGGYVFDLEVEGTHTYFANGIAVSNCHRSLADSYVTNIWEAYPDAIVIGLTATPCRGDGRPLGERYEELVVGATYSELIDGGFVADPIVYAPRVEPDTSQIRRVAGDWDASEVEEMMTGLAGEIVPTWLEHAGGRQTIVFASGVRHSIDIVRRFTEVGVAAEHLDGETPGDDRSAILSRLASGVTTVVSNCSVLTEGFDSPGVRCAVIARPTLSLVLHMQTAGRALRPGPVRPVIIDHAGNVGRHGMPHEDRVWSLHGPAKRVAAKNPYRICKACFAYYRITMSECPHCGVAPQVVERALPIEAPAVLERVNTPLLERNFYTSAVNLARSRGFKPGMASFKFKEHYARWPPWGWSQETKAMFASDAEWQRRLDARMISKAQFAEMEAAASASRHEHEHEPEPDNAIDYDTDHAPDPAPDPLPEDAPGAFDDLL